MPVPIVIKLNAWVQFVNDIGVREVRKVKGYHDEPLLGDRCGQRSIRLNRSYRAIYQEIGRHHARIVEIQEVNKHEY